MVEKVRRSISVPAETEVFQFAEVGFGERHPDLAIIHVVSAMEGQHREHWFALSRTMLTELGLRFITNAQTENLKGAGLH
jgi:hypothetical protein